MCPNEIPAQLEKVVLRSCLYGQAAGQCAEITNMQLRSENRVNLIINIVYRRDFMPSILEAYESFRALMNLCREPAESLKMFKIRF